MTGREREDDELESTHVQKSVKLTSGVSRPKRSTRGQGGYIARLEADSDRIRPDLRKGDPPRSKTRTIPAEVPVNDMAPPIKKRRGVKSSLPVQDERALTITKRKPSLVLAKPGSAFGFKPQTSDSTTEVGASDHTVFGGSMQPTANSEGDFEQAAQNEEPQNADWDPEDYGVDPSTNVNEGPDGPDLSDEEAAKSLKPRRLFRRNRHVLNSDEGSGEDLHAVRDVHLQQKQRALDDATNSVLNHPEPHIDEISPDEEERRASQFLNTETNVHNSHENENLDVNDEVEDDSQAVLDMHQQKNKPIKPPNPNALFSRSNVAQPSQRHMDVPPVTLNVSHRAPVPCESTNSSRLSNVTHGNKDVPRHANTFLGTDALPRPRYRDAPSVGVSHSVGMSSSVGVSDSVRASGSVGASNSVRASGSVGVSGSVGASSSGTFNGPTSDDESDSDVPVMAHVSCSSKSRKQPTSSQLGFYKGHWLRILTSAKALFRYHIHTAEIPFPERNNINLKLAHQSLLESVSNYLDNNEQIELDQDVYDTYKDGMAVLVFEEGATTRGRMKTIARDVVQIHYKDQLLPTLDFSLNSDQFFEIVAENVKTLLQDSTFHMGLTRDANGRTDNFSHPAVIELCKRFYYSGKQDALSSSFEMAFKTLPIPCLAMALTCLLHCLHEYRTGMHAKLTFKGQDYSTIYDDFLNTIKETNKHSYHGPKLQKLLRRIGKEGRMNSKQSNPVTRSFRARLD